MDNSVLTFGFCTDIVKGAYLFYVMINLTIEEQKLSDEAVQFIKIHAQEIIKKFAGDIPTEQKSPTTIFTAGSPGAGKTEFAQRLIFNFKERGARLVHIDADAIRSMLPGYTGVNSYVFQRAISLGVNKIFDHVIQTKKSCILDGTFSHYAIAHTNIVRSIKHGRIIAIAYLYEDPIRAWKFTQAREITEGRRILKEIFIEQFFAAPEVVMKINQEFGDRVELWRVTKNYEAQSYNIETGRASVDEPDQIKYSKDMLISSIV